jgi:hypothetical protein
MSSGGQIGALAGGIVGAAVGFYFGGFQGAGLGFSLGMTVGGIAGNAIDPVKPKKTTQTPGESLKDIFITSPALGVGIPRVFGIYRISGNIIHATVKEEHIIETDVQTAASPQPKGKGGGSATTTVKQKIYTTTLAIALCEGPISKILRVWLDLDLVYDNGNDLGRFRLVLVDVEEGLKVAHSIDETLETAIVHVGTEEQNPDATLEEIHGVGNVSAYRGLAYVVIKDLNLGTSGRVPNFTFEIQHSNGPSNTEGSGATVGLVVGLGSVSHLTNSSLTNSVGELTGYKTETLEVIGTQNAKLSPRGIAYSSVTNKLGVISLGLGDGQDTNTDMLTVYAGDSYNMFINDYQVRVAGEIAAHAVVGVKDIYAGGNYFYIYLEQIQSVVSFNINSNIFANTRFSVGTPVLDLVWSTGNIVFILRNNNTVAKTANAATITENINVGSGATHIIRASDNKIWVTNRDANTVGHFTSSGDYATISIPNGPHVITQAEDGYIWVGSTNAPQIHRIHQTAYTVETFVLSQSTISLAPGDGTIWAVASSGNEMFHIQSNGTFVSIRTPRDTYKVLSDEDGFAYGISSEHPPYVISPTASIGTSPYVDDGLACVVRHLSEEAGLTPGEIDTSGLDNTIVNMVLSNPQPAKDVIQTLADIFLFSGVESEGVMRYFFNSNAQVAATIPERALAGGIDKDDPKSLVLSRIQERELPTKVTINYPDRDRNFQSNSQIASLTSGSIERNPQVLNAPVALSGKQAYTNAEVRLYQLWNERELSEFTITPMLMLLDPRDNINVSARSFDYLMRISELNRGFNWITGVKSIVTDPAFYTETIPTPAISGVSTGTTLIIGRVDIYIVDVPALTPTDIAPRVFIAAFTTQNPRSFSYAIPYRSLDGGITYSALQTVATEAITGNVAAPLPNVDYDIWDDTTVLTVVLRRGTLSHSTELEVLNGANRAFVGNELIQFTTATLTATNTYQLTHLLRGRLGTESYVGTHSTNERFVLLNSVVVSNPIAYSETVVGVALNYKVVDLITPIDVADAFTQTIQGNNLKPWAPVLQSIQRNIPSANDITLAWLYRSRLNSELIDNTGVSWDIDFTKQFHVRIYTNSSYTVLMRLIVTSIFAGSAEDTLTQVYTAAQQVTDFGSVQSTIYYDVLGIGVNGILGYPSRGSG